MNTSLAAHSSRRARTRRLLTSATVGLLVIVADQVTKTVAVDRLTSGRVHVIGPFSLQLEYNTGVAFSLGRGLVGPIVIVGLVLVGLVVVAMRTAPSLPVAVGLGLIFGGAVGNLIDRLARAHGAVVDFIYTGFWPTFNLADSAVVCGCATLLVSTFVRDHGSKAHHLGDQSSDTDGATSDGHGN